MPAADATHSTSSVPQKRRQQLTTREVGAFDDMFQLIFNAASKQQPVAEPSFQLEEEITPDEQPVELPVTRGRKKRPSTEDGLTLLSSHDTLPQEQKEQPLAELFAQLKAKALTKMRTTKTEDHLLDVKKEEISLCASDREVLAWTMREFFQENATPQQTGPTSTTAQAIDAALSETSTTQQLSPSIQPAILALLMKTFRIKYNDPHLALSLFDHARHSSVMSYVTRCGTEAYNELVETRWVSFRDLRGVRDALEEMNQNQVPVDNRTRKLVERLRREVGERTLWEESGFAESHEGAMALLERVEVLSWRVETRDQALDANTDAEAAVLPFEVPDALDGLSSPTFQRRPHKSTKGWTPMDESWKFPTGLPSTTDHLSFT